MEVSNVNESYLVNGFDIPSNRTISPDSNGNYPKGNEILRYKNLESFNRDEFIIKIYNEDNQIVAWYKNSSEIYNDKYYNIDTDKWFTISKENRYIDRIKYTYTSFSILGGEYVE